MSSAPYGGVPVTGHCVPPLSGLWSSAAEIQTPLGLCSSSTLPEVQGVGTVAEAQLGPLVLAYQAFQHIWVVQSFTGHTDALQKSEIKKPWFSV